MSSIRGGLGGMFADCRQACAYTHMPAKFPTFASTLNKWTLSKYRWYSVTDKLWPTRGFFNWSQATKIADWQACRVDTTLRQYARARLRSANMHPGVLNFMWIFDNHVFVLETSRNAMKPLINEGRCYNISWCYDSEKILWIRSVLGLAGGSRVLNQEVTQKS